MRKWSITIAYTYLGLDSGVGRNFLHIGHVPLEHAVLDWPTVEDIWQVVNQWMDNEGANLVNELGSWILSSDSESTHIFHNEHGGPAGLGAKVLCRELVAVRNPSILQGGLINQSLPLTLQRKFLSCSVELKDTRFQIVNSTHPETCTHFRKLGCQLLLQIQD